MACSDGHPRIVLLLVSMLFASSVFGQDINLLSPGGGTLSFGNVRIADSSRQTVVFENVDANDLTVQSFGAVGVDVSQFPFVAPATPFLLMAAESSSADVDFAPSTVGNKSATFRIGSDDPDEDPLDVPMTGTGVRSYVDLSSMAPVAFGEVEDGTSSAAQTVTLSNQNLPFATSLNGTLSIAPMDSNFAVSPDTPFVLVPGGSVVLSLFFTPQSEGSKNATLTILSDDPVSPSVQISLSGDGTSSSGGGGGGAPGAGGGGGGGCLIETIAAGSSLEGSLDGLRALRHRLARDSTAGARLVATYYSLSRGTAGWFRGREGLRTAARWSLTPVVMVALHPLAALLTLFGAVLAVLLLRRR